MTQVATNVDKINFTANSAGVELNNNKKANVDYQGVNGRRNKREPISIFVAVRSKCCICYLPFD